MGFITVRNRSGREVYACEIGGEGCKTEPCRAHHCPFGWCQRYYICAGCWARTDVKESFSSAGHDTRGCKKNSEEYNKEKAEAAELQASGKYLRVAALNVDGLGVHVLFRNGAGEVVGRYMPREVYNAISIGKNAIIEDFMIKAAGLGYPSELQDAPVVFDYTGTATKQVVK